MTKVIDAHDGDEYSIPELSLESAFQFVRTNTDGSLVFKDTETSEERLIPYHAFASMRGLGAAKRTVREGVPTGVDSVNVLHLLDPDDPRIGKKERARRVAAQNRIVKARTIQHYLKRYDETPYISTYHLKLVPFLNRTFNEAAELKLGMPWKISPSVFRKALNRYGVPGNRPLGLILENFGKHLDSRWPDWVLELKRKMIELYWQPNVRKNTARSFFQTWFERERLERRLELISPPGRTTLNEWIDKSETQELYAEKFGRRNAHKRFVGTVDSVRATRPLEYVILDQTETDIFLLVKNKDGDVIRKMRAWLVYAIDVYSKMVLGFFLSLYPPTVYSLMKCIKHTLRPKTDLEERFGLYKGATDGWGKASTFILDNGLENIGVSLQTVLEYVGIDIIYASLRTPEHKALVERSFGTTNGLWHQLPGGRPGGKDKRNLPEDEPSDSACYTVVDATNRLSEYIVTVLHVETPRGGMSPARKFANGIKQHGRQTLDDVNLLDRLIGTYGRAVLTTSGITFKGESYHDQAQTTILIRDMATLAKKRQQRGPGQTIVIVVNVFYNPLNCGVLNVLNEATGILIQLPNVFPETTRELSFSMSKMLRKYEEEQGLLVHSDLERAQNRSKLFQHLENKFKSGVKPTKRQAREHATEMMWTLGQGNTVSEADMTPTVTGSHDIPTTAPVKARRNHGTTPKGPVRGGQKAIAKGVEARAKKLAEARALEDAKARKENTFPPKVFAPRAREIEITSDTRRDEPNVSDMQVYLQSRAADKSRRW
ncbi:DDE-type integrase/transposase/recombinase [Rhizobium phaseoli]|uniref:DDE-type integrase/transposase/recombinase n=1 Tax=Rhizobium phaseoli TaxID=396 RepID=UPI0002DF0F41|nr:DDE-type integrase/transposase/recombinase [Rhizobium phaseoli]KKZ86590.1 integrase [Rhizobium phaseoli Ch24-10]